MEQVVRHHQEAYGFDTMFDFGTRNPYRVAQAMSSPTYIVDDEAECVSVRDIHICEPKQGAQLAANYENSCRSGHGPRNSHGGKRMPACRKFRMPTTR